MNAKMTVKQLLEKAQDYASDCADAYTESKRLQFNTHGCMLYKTRESHYEINMQGQINDHALSQLIERLDAPPMAWIANDKRCSPYLRAKIFNNLVAERPDAGLLIRHKGDHVRAVLSNQYTKFDNVKLIDLVAQALDANGIDAQVLRPNIGDYLSAYIMIPSITFDFDPNYHGKDNGGLHPAVYIGNSETGTSSVHITGGLYRGFCDNGSIYGWKQEEALAVRHRYLSEFGLRSIVASGIASAMHMSEECAKAYVQAQEIHIEEVSLKGIISEWANKYGLTISAKENWLKCVTAEVNTQNREQPLLVDVFNGATYSAHAIENVQEREMVERMAGDMLYNFTHRR